MLNETTQALASKLPEVNPELARAAPERVHAKARGAVATVLLTILAVGLWVGGGVLVGLFAHNAIKSGQPLSLGLMAALGCPLVPAVLVSIFAAKYFDSDAGSVIDQMVNVVAAWRGKGTDVPQ